MSGGVLLWGWDDTNEKWIKVLVDTEGKVQTVAVIDNLNDIGDVNVPVLTDGYVLYWDATAGKFQLKVVVGGYTEGARVYHSVNQTIPDSTLTILAFDSERWDTDTIHDLVTNNSRLTCKIAGIYISAVNLGFEFHATGSRQVRILLNGATIIANNSLEMITTDARFCLTTIYDLAINDYVEAQVYQTSGGNLEVRALGNWSPEFMMQRIG